MASRAPRHGLPPEWAAAVASAGDEVETITVRLPVGLGVRGASERLRIHSAISGWELWRTRLYGDGSRRVLLRRRRRQLAGLDRDEGKGGDVGGVADGGAG